MSRYRLPVFALFLVALALGGCRGPDDATPAQAAPEPAYDAATLAAIDDYEREARGLSEAITRGDDVDGLLEGIDRLFELGETMRPAFVARHPACSAYLAAAFEVRTRWRDMDADTLERDYHHDGALRSEGIRPACYHIKDLVVHPATAAALLSQDPPDREAARRELDEVIAHLGVVRQG